MTNHPLYHSQTVSIPVQVVVKDALVVDSVDTDFARAVKDMLSIGKDTDMGDVPFGIIKKSEVTGSAVVEKADRFPLGCLLCSIPQQADPMLFVNYLGQPGAINAQEGFSSPQVGAG